MIGVSILGSTGTIGRNTLDVIAQNRDCYRVVALTACTDVKRLAQQCKTWNPTYAVMADTSAAERLVRQLAEEDVGVEVLSGVEGLSRVAALPQVDYVLAGIVGAAGLLPTLAAARAGKRVLLANKESLVMSGRLLMDTAQANNAELLPIDSEHNAIFQCLPPGVIQSHDGAGVRRILLTGSGGPFRNRSPDQLESVTPEQACAHPNWVMGRKISVDSATMMNKGLEVIEACWLFDTTPERVEVVIHPQSIVHSMVEFNDGSVLAQLSNPDMRIPIAHALSWPKRMNSGAQRLDLKRVGQLNFEEVDFRQFPCLRLGYDAASMGGTAATILNAANEIAVDAFLNCRIRFTDIPEVIESTMNAQSVEEVSNLETVLSSDHRARAIARDHIMRLAA